MLLREQVASLARAAMVAVLITASCSQSTPVPTAAAAATPHYIITTAVGAAGVSVGGGYIDGAAASTQMRSSGGVFANGSYSVLVADTG